MFEIKTRTVRSVLIVDCVGRIVFGEATDELRQQVRAVMPDSAHVVLNLRGVTYIDSAGVGTLVGLYTSAKSRGGDVRLAAVAPFVRGVLRVTHLDSIFAIFDDIETAVYSYQSTAA